MRGWIKAVVLISLVIVVYIPSINGDFVWDDDLYLTKNPLIYAPDGLRRIWFSTEVPTQYFPLVYTSFRIEYSLWGLRPTGYHLVNILLHAINAVLLWHVLKFLSFPGSWLAAVIFAVHPVQVESVAWISERKNVLSGAFYFLTLIAWLKFSSHENRWRWVYYFQAVGLYALALFSKTTTATLPIAIILILWLKKERIDRSRLAQILPFALMGLAMGALTIWWERFHQGTRGPDFSLSIAERLLIAGRAFWFYLGKLLWPVNLCFSYSRWDINPVDLKQWLWPLAVIVLFGLLWRWRRKTGQGPIISAVFFMATLSPLLGFIALFTFKFSFVADHYQYLACIGPITILSALLIKLRVINRGVSLAATATILIVLSWLSWNQNKIYTDGETLWRDTLHKNPQSWLAHNNLGRLLYSQGKTDEAISHYNEALRLAPEEGLIHSNFGIALAKKGMIQEAIREQQTALRLLPLYPNAHNNLGMVLFLQGLTKDAIGEYAEALRLKPNYAEAHFNMGRALASVGRMEEADVHFHRAIEIDHDYIDALYNSGCEFLARGKIDEAILYFREALKAESNHLQAYNNLANALTMQGKLREAEEVYRRALQVDRKFADAYLGLGVISFKQVKLDEAEKYFSQALRMKPDFASAHFNLGVIFEMKGMIDSAVSHYREAVRISPSDAEARFRLEKTLRREGTEGHGGT